MLIYATPGDLYNWTTDTPDNAEALLRTASGLVRWATRAARYSTDRAGKPADPEIAQAFRDATCAQVAFWIAADIDVAGGGVGKTEPVVTSKSMGGRSVTYADLSGSVAQARTEAATQLCDEAWTILAGAGLIGGQPDVL